MSTRELYCSENRIAMKLLILLCILPITYTVYDKDLNKPKKDKYYLQRSCEMAVNKQINDEKRARFMYDAMAAHFGQNSVARHGFAKFFSERAEEQEERSQKFINYLNERSGTFTGFDVKVPVKYSWGSALEALRDAATLEKHLNTKLHTLHDVATVQCSDQHLMDFLENEFIDVQVKTIDILLRYISELKGMDTGMGEYFLDKELLEKRSEL